MNQLILIGSLVVILVVLLMIAEKNTQTSEKVDAGHPAGGVVSGLLLTLPATERRALPIAVL